MRVTSRGPRQTSPTLSESRTKNIIISATFSLEYSMLKDFILRTLGLSIPSLPISRSTRQHNLPHQRLPHILPVPPSESLKLPS